jgi:hypothetical protein
MIIVSAEKGLACSGVQGNPSLVGHTIDDEIQGNSEYSSE